VSLVREPIADWGELHLRPLLIPEGFDAGAAADHLAEVMAAWGSFRSSRCRLRYACWRQALVQ